VSNLNADLLDGHHASDFATTVAYIPYTGATGDADLGNNSIIATFFQISTAPTANSTGTVAIAAKDANLLTANVGWLPLKRSDGTIVYVPYWL
jgi:hypothetical protein